jgi:hypothetical protein
VAMISPEIPEKIVEEINIKKELSAVFIRIGLITVFIGIASILIGLWLKDQYIAQPLLVFAPLLVGLPVMIAINIFILRRKLSRLNSATKK